MTLYHLPGHPRRRPPLRGLGRQAVGEPGDPRQPAGEVAEAAAPIDLAAGGEAIFMPRCSCFVWGIAD